MLNFIIIASMIAVFLIGFVFIDKIYSLAEQSTGKHPKKVKIVGVNSNTEKALIFGNLDDDIAALLNNSNILCSKITDTNILDKSDNYKYLFAVSDSDLDNLVICSTAKKVLGVKKIVALCNCSYNKKIYEDNHIPYLYGNKVTASEFVTKLIAS